MEITFIWLNMLLLNKYRISNIKFCVGCQISMRCPNFTTRSPRSDKLQIVKMVYIYSWHNKNLEDGKRIPAYNFFEEK
jgi:hypothetical protein